MPVPPVVKFPTLITAPFNRRAFSHPASYIQFFPRATHPYTTESGHNATASPRGIRVTPVGPKYFAISSIARAVAPRLSSTNRFAVSLIARGRYGSRNISIHATPASSGLSTCTAAFAETNRDAISAKFSIDGPNTGTFPNAAGSKILCPPDSTSDPPTNAPSANRYKDANSPIESSSNTVTSDVIAAAPFAVAPFPAIFNSDRRRNFLRDS